ncbi:MAG: GDSL-type esterase/lipase family protein [Fibrobacter sp.]|jgi:lysophospholipase L1-like esterase|nr:GDSL-type esterase/lipase family protein [Fibrobacter sp.]
MIERSLALLFVLALTVFSADSTSLTARLIHYPFIDTSFNHIIFPKGDSAFSSFYAKMDSLVFHNKGQVNILHLGGSHIQADVISNQVRERLATEYPGKAASRGFVFPYSAAHTNTPVSYGSGYRGKWSMTKSVVKPIQKPLGLLGIAATTSDPRAEVTILLNKYNTKPLWFYDQVRVFGFADSNDVIPVIQLDSISHLYGQHDSLSGSYVFNLETPRDTLALQFLWEDTALQDSLSRQIVMDSIYQDSIAKLIHSSSSKASKTSKKVSSSSGASLSSSSAAPEDTIPPSVYPTFTLTGILLENDSNGISYTSIGINGAGTSAYLISENLVRDLQFIKPDLLILSIGINDANVEYFDDRKFQDRYDTLITRIRSVSPDVAILFTTNNDSYRKVKKRRFVTHPNGEVARKAFFSMATRYHAGVWDLFSLMGGLGSMAKWEKASLAKKDRVHFNQTGYKLLGDLLYEALIEAYLAHVARLPAKDP